MKNIEISDLYAKLKDRQEKFRYWQLVQERLKHEHNMYDPYDYPNMSEREYQMAVQKGISGNSIVLRDLENEIKELRKIIKQMDREQNKKL